MLKVWGQHFSETLSRRADGPVSETPGPVSTIRASRRLSVIKCLQPVCAQAPFKNTCQRPTIVYGILLGVAGPGGPRQTVLVTHPKPRVTSSPGQQQPVFTLDLRPPGEMVFEAEIIVINSPSSNCMFWSPDASKCCSGPNSEDRQAKAG